MAVYVDNMYRYAIGQFRGMQMSHLIADTAEELHAFALRIGMRRGSYQGDHYDIPLRHRCEAIASGAIVVTYRQCGMMRRRQAVEGTCGDPADAARWYRQWLRGRSPRT